MGSDLEQVFILELTAHTSVLVESNGLILYQLGEVLNLIKLVSHNFLFSPEALKEELDYMLDNAYLFDGDRYSREIYGH